MENREPCKPNFFEKCMGTAMRNGATSLETAATMCAAATKDVCGDDDYAAVSYSGWKFEAEGSDMPKLLVVGVFIVIVIVLVAKLLGL